MVNFKAAFGQRDFLLLTLDALRFDVASAALTTGQIPNLAATLNGGTTLITATSAFKNEPYTASGT